MSCRRIDKLLPLYAGGDLPAKKAAKVRAHADACPSCRREIDGLRAALDATKALARADELGEWRETDWRALMRSVASAKTAAKRPFAPFALRPVAVGALALLLVAAGALFLLRKPAGRTVALQAASSAAAPRASTATAGPEKPKPTVLRIVTKDGQLKVIWPFDSDFNLSRYGK